MAATDIKLFGKWSYEEDEVKVSRGATVSSVQILERGRC